MALKKNRTRKRSTPGTGTPKLTRADDRVLAARYIIATGVALVSVTMSYQALATLADRGHIAEQWRWVWPVIVVAPELAGALAVVAAQRRNQDAAWSWFLLITATAVSVAANVASAPPDLLPQIVHGAVPVVGFIQVKDVCNGIRKRLEAAEPEAARAPAERPTAPAPLPAPEPVVIRVPVDEPAFAVPPKPTTAPEPEAVPAAPEPAPATEPVPAALRSVPKPGPAPAGTKIRAIDRHAELARKWMKDEPEITGSEIGRRLGKSERYGRNVLSAATA